MSKAVLTIIENHPSGEPAAILSWDDQLTQEAAQRLQQAFSRWWAQGGGMLLIAHLEVVRVKSIALDIDRAGEVTVLGTP